jgi:hypothetical protein
MTIEQILDEFRYFDGVYRRNAVDAAVRLREEITPHLIRVLEEVAEAPVAVVEDDDRYSHIYAMVLLTHFREPRAHEAIVRIHRLPEDLLDPLFGDGITENFASALYATSSGSMARVRELIADASVYEYCRSAAMDAMVFAVAEERLSRNEVLEFLLSFFGGDEAEEESQFWSFLAGRICDLSPGEYMTRIEEAYVRGLIFPGYVRLEDFHRSVLEGPEVALARVRREVSARLPADVHGHMSWWACFNPPAPVSPVGPRAAERRDQAKRSKKKRKMEKASRRKNRKR